VIVVVEEPSELLVLVELAPRPAAIAIAIFRVARLIALIRGGPTWR